jgi:hypothetical protein
MQINELSECDVPSKLMDCKRQIVSLQHMLAERDQERDNFLTAQGGNDSVHGKAWLEKQSA